MWYAVGIIWFAAMVWIISRYSRKQRQRTSERAQHMEQLLVELKSNVKADAAAAEAAIAPDITLTSQFRRRPRLLPPPAALLYYVIRTGMPDHEIFAGVALDEVVEINSAGAGEQREAIQRKLAGQRLDFVVCTKQLEVVAAVMLSAGNSPTDGSRFVETCLAAAAVRLVRIDPAAPPRHQQVHALMYG
jgi:hypothetical protein